MHFSHLPLPLLALLPTFTSAVIITLTSTSTITASAASSTPNDQSDQYTSDPTFESAILNSTNTYRAAHDATALTWNSTLAAYALSWASSCKWSHSCGPYGENLAESYPNVTAAIDAWGDERRKYNFDKGVFGEGTGHFTQLVWKGTTTVGCARVDCADKEGGDAEGWFVVCEYFPMGNVEGQFKEEVGREIDKLKGPLDAYVAHVHDKISGVGRSGLSWGSLLAVSLGCMMGLVLVL